MTNSLLKGFARFRDAAYKHETALMPTLVKNGQAPKYFIISCIDSRGNAGTIFDVPPGTFLSHNAMGAIVRPYTKGTALSAALQFALIHNRVEEIIVVAHTGCGATQALLGDTDDEEISSFLSVARTALDAAKRKLAGRGDEKTLLRATEEQMVLQSVENLRSYPSVAEALRENRVKITPWLFDMEDGQMLEYNQTIKAFTTRN